VRIQGSDQSNEVIVSSSNFPSVRVDLRDFVIGATVLRARFDSKRDVVVQCIESKPLHYVLQYVGSEYQVKVESPLQHKLSEHMPVEQKHHDAKVLRSPMPGSVLSVNVKLGDKVLAGQEVAVVEAMKMQNVLRAHRDGVVKAVLAGAGRDVAVDEVIVEFQ